MAERIRKSFGSCHINEGVVLEYNEDGKIAGNMEWFDLGGIFDQLEESTEAEE